MAFALICAGTLGMFKVSKAATGNYDFTVTTSNTYDSHYASKAGGASFENCAYITPSYFSKTGTVWFWVKMKGQNVQTEKKQFSSGSEGNTRVLYYTSTPTSGLLYHVGGKIQTVSSGNTINVKGAFTP